MILLSVFHLGKKTVNSTARQELMMRHRRRVIFSVIVTAIGKSNAVWYPINYVLLKLFVHLS
jgi:hypothetical protein